MIYNSSAYFPSVSGSSQRLHHLHHCSMKPSRRLFLSRKCIQKVIFGMFMVYVVLSLHELRTQHLNIQVVLKSDEPLHVPQLENGFSTHPRFTRQITKESQQLKTSDIHDRKNVKKEKENVQAAMNYGFPGDAENSNLSLNDIHISLKTSKKFHHQRLDIILRTWFNEAKEQTFIITDEADEEFERRTGGQLVNSNCTGSHNRKALCCKMSTELDLFIARDKKWFCHFDDDQYVNVRSLLNLLNQYDSGRDFYLGKPSIKAPLEISHSESAESKSERATFWFATGGAGFCLSRHLVDKMKPIISGGKFMSVGEQIRLPDDVTIGFIIEYMLRTPLTVINKFHSHLEPLQVLSEEDLRNDISFGYSAYRGNQMNRVTVTGWDFVTDPTRFYSLHCFLEFKSATKCPNTKR